MFGLVNFLQRLLLVNFFVLGLYNPTGVSYYHWITSSSFSSYALVVGMVMIAFFVFVVRSTYRSLKFTGVLIGLLFCFSFNVMLIDLGFFGSDVRAYELSWMIVFSIAFVLAVGLSFSAIRARLSGQIDSDDIGTQP